MPIKLLVIDDEEIIRNIWDEIFVDDDNYNVNLAANGEEGVQYVKKNDYDIIVTDLNMPGISGLEVVEKVKKIKPEIEVIIMTAYGTVEYAVSAMKKGAFDFILKPLDFEQVKLVLKKCFKQIKYKRENKDLKELNLKLKELNEVREKFITITSHELRTPANAISGLIELLHEWLPEEITSKYKNEFDILLAACNNLKEIVNDMHDLSLAGAGGLKINRFPFNIDMLASELNTDYKVYSINRDLKFEIKNKLDGEHFNGDIRRIKQAAGELIQNAVKYTKDGGSIDITLDKKEENNTEYLIMAISDTGIGIEQGHLDKIFDAFYEVQESSKHHSSKTEFMGGGIGVGLSIVKEIAEAHSGKVIVDSEPEKGSTFKLYLPYKD